jgi:hypothetical protein
MTTESSPDPIDQKETETATSRRSMLRTAAIIGGATIAGGTLVSRQAAAANGDPVLVGGNFQGTSPTEIYYHGSNPYPAGPSVVSGGEDNSPLQPLFPAGVGGYGVDKVVNGVHGSTAVNTGFGVVAANGAAPANGSAAPKALALASLGSQVQFLTPAQVAAAAGLVNYPATVGPSAGTHSPGELYVDDEYNLWFAVPNGATVRWIRLAGQQTGGSLVTFPTPVRILDTRANNGSKVPNGATVTVGLKTAASGASSGLPVGATTAVLNLTVDGTEGRGYHAAYSADATLDPASPFSSVNWDAAGQTRANLAVVRLGSATPATERAVKFTAGGGGSTHLIVDLVGYYV